MSDHGTSHDAFTEDARPHAQRRAIADQDLDQDRDRERCGSSGAGHLLSAPHDRRLATSSGFETQPTAEQLQQVVTDLQASEAEALRDRELADREVRRLRKEADLLRRELQEAREDDPRSKLIRDVLDYWVKSLGKTARTKCPANGARWNKVRMRLTDGFTVAQLKLAIDGCARFPFVGPRGRQPDEQGGAKRHDDIELICRDETTVERFIGYADQPDVPAPVPATPAVQPVRRREKVRTELPIDRVILALHGAGCQVVTHNARHDQWSAQCPAHEDRDPSLSVHRNPDGQILIKCWAGCETEDVLRALHLEWPDLWEDSDRDPNRLNAPVGRGVPGHLRHAMQQLLDRDERQAA